MDESSDKKAMHALLAAQSPRLTHIASQMKGEIERNYDTIQRFLIQLKSKSTLVRLHLEGAEFLTRDPTVMPHHKAPKTDYAGKLKDREMPVTSTRETSRRFQRFTGTPNLREVGINRLMLKNLPMLAHQV